MPDFIRIYFGHIGSGVELLWRTARYLPTLPRQMDRLVYQCYSMGYATLPLVAILSFFIGAVLALQIGYSMRDFAVNDFIGAIVGLSLVRELAPVMTAIMLAGRVGSAMTAELASMRVYQEVDALVTMNIPPERFLVLPRMAAILLVMPILTMVAVVSGWIGGQLIAQFVPWIGLTPQAYYNSLKGVMTVKDITDGLIKAQMFALMIGVICCNVGLNTRGGPREIGSAVTKAVVACIIFILVLDYFITTLLV